MAEYPEAIANLDVIDACEGDLERAARVLVRRAGAEDDRFVSNWLEQGLQQCREVICEEDFKDNSLPERLAAVKRSLAASNQPFWVALEVPVALYIAKRRSRKTKRKRATQRKKTGGKAQAENRARSGGKTAAGDSARTG